MKFIFNKPDGYGALASILCVIHCLTTPLFFMIYASTIGDYEKTAVWWKSLDFIFLTISFFAIYRSTQTTSKKIMKYALWLNWSLLLSKYGVFFVDNIL